MDFQSDLVFQTLHMDQVRKNADFKFKGYYDSLYNWLLGTGSIEFVSKETGRKFNIQLKNDKIEYFSDPDEVHILERELQ